jgi:RNA polymerase sigma-70 factor, ECF subfamily
MMTHSGDRLEFRGMERRDGKNDVLLVRECLAGSEAAWQEFYARFIRLIRSVVRRQARLTPSDIQDIEQLVFLDLTTALNSYDQGSSLPHFVCMITRRVIIDEIRKTRALKRHAETQALDHHDGSEEGAAMIKSNLETQDSRMERAEMSRCLKSAMNELDSRCQELIRLRYYKELAFGEIAEIMGVSENTLTVRTRRCLDKLRIAFHNLECRGKRP